MSLLVFLIVTLLLGLLVGALARPAYIKLVASLDS
jgi:hypothetical protein